MAGETVILLVGKTGYGKSATGNTILGQILFEESDSGESCTNAITIKSSRRDGQTITVLDGPGILNTQHEPGKGLQQYSNDIRSAIQQYQKGINALLFVSKYPDGFTEFHGQTIPTLKSIFGQNAFRDFGIVVFTYGELFDMKYKKKGTDFQAWVKEQKTEMNALLEECNYRTILLRNSSADDDQVQKLLGMIHDMNKEREGVLYNAQRFEEAQIERNRPKGVWARIRHFLSWVFG